MSNGDSLIGIVGAGRLGRVLAGRAAAAKLEVVVCNSRDPRTIAAVSRNVKAVWLAEALDPEIVVLAIPWARVAEASAAVVDWEGRIVVDATNAFQAESRELGSSERVADLLPGAQVVKAFNTVPADLLAADPEGGRWVVFLAGNHQRSRAEVGRLVARLGYSPIELGDLLQGRLFEPGGPLGGRTLIDPDQDSSRIWSSERAATRSGSGIPR